MSRNIEQVSAKEAYERAKSNPQRRYPSPNLGANRLRPTATPTGRPSFQISPDESFFTIGSCFARSLEVALINAGMQVTSHEVDLGIIGDSRGFTPNFFNKYSVHSIYNDLKWALERETFPGADILYHVEGKSWYADLQLGLAKLEFPVEAILAFRTQYLDVLARVADADIVVVTLGYVETWFDTKLGIYINTSPPLALVNAEPDRFEFRVLSYEDVLSGLHDIRELLEKHRTKPLRMLLTVSPVPLLSTFRDMDVLVANTYSKSVQRAAIDAFIRDSDNIDYFPSYEFVMLSNPDVAWQDDDFRHVSPDLVASIMANVIDQYITDPTNIDGEQSIAHNVAATMRLSAKAKDYHGVITAAEGAPDLVTRSTDLMLLLAQAHVQIGDTGTAIDLLVDADNLPTSKGGPLEALINLALDVGEIEVARHYLKEHEQRYPKRAGFRNRTLRANNLG